MGKNKEDLTQSQDEEATEIPYIIPKKRSNRTVFFRNGINDGKRFLVAPIP